MKYRVLKRKLIKQFNRLMAKPRMEEIYKEHYFL